MRAIDEAGNIDASPATRNFTVDTGATGDTTPPETTILSGPKDVVKTTKKRAKVVFEFSSSEMGSSFECNFNELGWQECFDPFTQVKVQKGKWHLDVRATDQAGNTDETPAEWDWVVKRKKKN